MGRMFLVCSLSTWKPFDRCTLVSETRPAFWHVHVSFTASGPDGLRIMKYSSSLSGSTPGYSIRIRDWNIPRRSHTRRRHSNILPTSYLSPEANGEPQMEPLQLSEYILGALPSHYLASSRFLLEISSTPYLSEHPSLLFLKVATGIFQFLRSNRVTNQLLPSPQLVTLHSEKIHHIRVVGRLEQFSNLGQKLT